MRVLTELTGRKFGRLTVIKLAYKKKGQGAFWLCKCDCGNSKIAIGYAIRAGNILSCGCLKRENITKRNKAYVGKNNHFWKDGRSLEHGYVSLRMPNHPNARHDGRVFEHIYIMSEYLNRPLSKGELVHHKNGIRDDNELENLELRTSVHPSGQSVEDMVKFCIQYLQKYAPGVLKVPMPSTSQRRKGLKKL